MGRTCITHGKGIQGFGEKTKRIETTIRPIHRWKDNTG
jgi:hypothetical protein